MMLHGQEGDEQLKFEKPENPDWWHKREQSPSVSTLSGKAHAKRKMRNKMAKESRRRNR